MFEAIASGLAGARAHRLRRLLSDERFIGLVLFVALPAVAAIQRFLLGPLSHNNYLVFRSSFLNLLRGQDLYALHPESHWDLYKYSPTFALAMGPFAALPDWLGLLAWNLFNSLALFFAIRALPVQDRVRRFVYWFVCLEALTAAHNQQSNSLLAALMVLAFVALEDRRDWRAAFLVACAGFIKVYGFGAAALFLMYPRRRRLFGALAVWSAVLWLLPLVVTSPSRLLFQYRSWGSLLANDHAISYGLSVMGILHSWFGFDPGKLVVAWVGVVLYVLPYAKLAWRSEAAQRLSMLCSTLVFMIIFNHKAESATFVIAVTGVAIWYATQAPNPVDRILIVLAFLLTVLSPTDLVPKSVRIGIVLKYALKALPCVLIWIRMQQRLLLGPAPESASPSPSESVPGIAPG